MVQQWRSLANGPPRIRQTERIVGRLAHPIFAVAPIRPHVALPVGPDKTLGLVLKIAWVDPSHRSVLILDKGSASAACSSLRGGVADEAIQPDYALWIASLR